MRSRREKLPESQEDHPEKDIYTELYRQDAERRGIDPMTVNNHKPTMKKHELMAQTLKLLQEGKSFRDIATELGIAPSTVSDYYKELDSQLKEQHLSDFQSVRAREVQYALEMRASVREMWNGTKKVAYGQLVLQWSDRIAKLQGLDAPLKTEDWTNRDYEEYVKQYAVEHNLTNEQAMEQVIAEAERVISESRTKIGNDTGTGGATLPETEGDEAPGLEVDSDS